MSSGIAFSLCFIRARFIFRVYARAFWMIATSHLDVQRFVLAFLLGGSLHPCADKIVKTDQETDCTESIQIREHSPSTAAAATSSRPSFTVLQAARKSFYRQQRDSRRATSPLLLQRPCNSSPTPIQILEQERAKSCPDLRSFASQFLGGRPVVVDKAARNSFNRRRRQPVTSASGWWIESRASVYSHFTFSCCVGESASNRHHCPCHHASRQRQRLR